MTTATGGRMRDQPERDVVVAERALEAAAYGLNQQQEEGQRQSQRQLPGEIQADHERDRERHRQDEQTDVAEPRPVGHAREPVARHAPERQRDHRARERHDHRVQIGPEGVGAEIDEDVLPGVQRRLEIDPHQIERPIVNLDWELEGGDEHPIEGEQHHERPEAQHQIAERHAER
jgi:hypothetical protein